jgi:hypothetical protein
MGRHTGGEDVDFGLFELYLCTKLRRHILQWFDKIAGRIGHTDLTMLQKHYAAIVGTAAVEAADTIQRIFDQENR